MKRAGEVGMNSIEHKLPADCSQETLNQLIAELNANPAVDGILVQLPLPDHLNEAEVIAAISPQKDVDGFHPMNVGALACGEPALVPCTPLGCMIMLRQVCDDLSGKHAVVIGRSNIVGKPMAALLLQANCSVTVVHSRTRNIEAICSQADIVVAAIGRPEQVKSSWIKPGAIVIDVGINAIERDGRRRLVGDVDFANAEPLASAITRFRGRGANDHRLPYAEHTDRSPGNRSTTGSPAESRLIIQFYLSEIDYGGRAYAFLIT